MAKKLKSESQLRVLRLYFKKKSDQWPKKDLIALAKKTRLSRSQIYKWLWDQRKQYKLNQGEGSNHIESNDHIKKQPKTHQKILSTSYKTVTFTNENQQVIIHVPKQLKFVTKITVPNDTSEQTVNELKTFGSLLCKFDYDSIESPKKMALSFDFEEKENEENCEEDLIRSMEV